MAKFTIINKFKDISFDINNKPLIICDIDLTIIKPESNIEYYRSLLNSKFHKKKDLEDIAKSMYRTALCIGLVKQTDSEGFYWLIEQLEKHSGKLLLLTSRGQSSHEKTLNDLLKVGIKNPENFEIHYTNGQITKGEYIKRKNLLEGFEHVSFIDDCPQNLSSAFEIYPHINCYLFKCD